MSERIQEDKAGLPLPRMFVPREGEGRVGVRPPTNELCRIPSPWGGAGVGFRESTTISSRSLNRKISGERHPTPAPPQREGFLRSGLVGHRTPTLPSPSGARTIAERGGTFVLLLSMAFVSQADRLITIPTAHKLRIGEYRYEITSLQGAGRESYQYLGTGLTSNMDIEFRTERFPGANERSTFDLSYNHFPAGLDIVPGLSVGVQDAMNQTRDGRRFYLATSFTNIFGTINGDVPADVTLGGFFGAQSSAFVGVSIPFSKEVRLLAEDNGYRLTAGFEVRPVKWLGLRMLFRNQQTFVDASVTRRF